MWRLAWLGLALFVGALDDALAETLIDVPITRDTFIQQTESTPRCTSGILCIGNQPNFNEHVVVAFDLPDAPACGPNQYICAEATLHLCTIAEPDNRFSVQAHRISPDYVWNESQTACNQQCPTRDCPPIYRAHVLGSDDMETQEGCSTEIDISYAVSCWYNNDGAPNPAIPNRGIALIPVGATTQNGCFTSSNSTAYPQYHPYVRIARQCCDRCAFDTSHIPNQLAWWDPDLQQWRDPLCPPMGADCVAAVEASTWGFIKSVYQ